ncbi:hypothetical protein H0H93_005792 [Arthromyces matolae]|nr:hypothetical protein H0H93_005792 [Arthromyces matolae]
MCRINKKARRTLALAAPEVFTCSTRSLLLETENGDTSSWYSIIFCPNVINFSARSVGSMLLSPPPMVIWQKCRFPSILKYVYLGNLNTFQFSSFEEWIRQCLGGHDLQITHLKVEVQSGITDTQITSLLEAIGTAPLEVLSIEGALQANLPLFDWIANHMPTLRALTIIRRDSTRSRKTNSITWPLHVGEYAQRLSSLPSLQHFGWNNCKPSEQYATYSLPFLEGGGIVDKDSVQLPYHDERLSPVDEYMPIVFGALCPTLQTLGLSFMNYRISRPSEGVIKAESDFSRRYSGEYDPHPLIEGCWPHRPSLSNT